MIKKILIVDDSPIARKMLKSCLPKDQEYEFHEAGDGKEGFGKYMEINPDLTFMDLTMPIMTGYESIDEPNPQGRFGIDHFPGKDQLLRSRNPDKSLKPLRSPGPRDDAEGDLGLPKAGVLRGNSQIAGQCNFTPSPQGEPLTAAMTGLPKFSILSIALLAKKAKSLAW